MSTAASRYLGRVAARFHRQLSRQSAYLPLPGDDPFMAGQRVMRQRCADAVRHVSAAAERRIWEVAVSAAPLRLDAPDIGADVPGGGAV